MLDGGRRLCKFITSAVDLLKTPDSANMRNRMIPTVFLTDDNRMMSRGEVRRKICSHSSIESVSNNNRGSLGVDMSLLDNVWVVSPAGGGWDTRDASDAEVRRVDRSVQTVGYVVLLR